MRPQHWVKNVFVAAPLLFSGRFTSFGAWLACLGAVAAFCLLSSSVYLFNDICDRRQDAMHPLKRRRPIASGRLSAPAAGLASFLLAAAGLALVAGVQRMALTGIPPSEGNPPLHGLGLMVWTVAYVLLNLLYSLWLK